MANDKIIDSLFDNNLEQFRNEVRAALYVKAGQFMESQKQAIAGVMINGAEDVQEELKGKQHKIDANKNGKIDAEDFKMLRKKKG
jgi:hypothetical protein